MNEKTQDVLDAIFETLESIDNHLKEIDSKLVNMSILTAEETRHNADNLNRLNERIIKEIEKTKEEILAAIKGK